MTPDADTTQQGCASPSPDQRRMSAAYSTPGGREEREPTIVTRDVGERDVSSAEQGEGIVNGGGNNGGESTKKRKLSPPDERKSTGRGVANLTPEQLAKKRANDREAQRSIRQRTKLQIETLETRIRDLTSQQPYQELQHVIQQKQMVDQENSDIKKRLTQVIALITPILGTHGLEVPQLAPQPNYHPPNQPNYANRNVSTPSSIASPAPFLDIGPERLGLDFLLDEGQRHKIPIPPSGTQETPGFQQSQRPIESVNPTHHRNNSTGKDTNHNTPNPALAPAPGPGSEMNGYSAPIRNSPPPALWIVFSSTFFTSGKNAALEGLPTQNS
ncbi:hypothetical protein DID88_002806 [Monilinia fructigena]|uniref:BZIP domain-containing protein n=1 Tax=Monilinia fructigena TaxID=38457 RepID=A0A395ITR3_9HELO|nr:hypothetical protein DID88_002806 [Monilinia fructigena]